MIGAQPERTAGVTMNRHDRAQLARNVDDLTDEALMLEAIQLTAQGAGPHRAVRFGEQGRHVGRLIVDLQPSVANRHHTAAVAAQRAGPDRAIGAFGQRRHRVARQALFVRQHGHALPCQPMEAAAASLHANPEMSFTIFDHRGNL